MPRFVVRRRFAFGAVLLLASGAAAADEVLLDHWFATFHAEHKVGWAHVRRVRTTEDGRTVYVTRTESEQIRGPEGGLLEKPIRASSRFVEDEAGSVLEYATSVDIGRGPQERAGTVRDGVVSAVEDGRPRTVAYPAGAIGPAALDRAVAASLTPGFAGEALEFVPLDPHEARPVKWKVPAQTELVDVLGRFWWLYRVEFTDPTGLPEHVWPDGAGGRWADAINLGVLRSFRTEEVVARADRDPASWLTQSLVEPDREIPKAARRGPVRLRLSRDAGPVGDLPESRSQRVVSRGKDGRVEIELTDGRPTGDLVVWVRPYAGGDQDEFLRDTALLVLSHERVKRAAAGAVEGHQDALSCARLLELRARQYLRPAPANVGFGSAPEVLSSRTGDFTEAAVLAVAFARSVGLPARLVAGFVYWGPAEWPADARPKGAFAPHVWAEVYAGDDLWVPLDPMRMTDPESATTIAELAERTGFDATHVAVLRSDADTGQPFTDVLLPVLRFLDGLEIEVLGNE